MPLAPELLQLLSPRPGHFQLESGYHSELWFDLDRLFMRPNALQPFVAELARRLSVHSVAAICGPQTGGAKLAQMLGAELGLPWQAATRVADPAAAGLFPVRYRLPRPARQRLRGQAVAIVDDAISAGSAIRGCHADLLEGGARPVALGALIVFGGKAEEFAQEAGVPLERIAQMAFGLWLPSECPHCRTGGVAERISDQMAGRNAGESPRAEPSVG